MTDKIRKTQAQWQQQLTSQQFQVCRQRGTERPFTGEYWNCKKSGIYTCVCCGAELFKSTDKYDSGSGWPSFIQAINESAIELRADNSLGMKRVEVVCARCDAHLGHVFDDGPQPTGLRFCINSVALQLKSS